MLRELEFLAPLSVSIASQHRTEGPRGLAGGEPGQPGCQRIVRAGGAVETRGSVDGAEVAPGDRLIIETPGGGGWGRAGKNSTRRAAEGRGGESKQPFLRPLH